MQTIVARQNKEITTELDLNSLRSLVKHGKEEVWIDMAEPSSEQIAALGEVFGYDPDVLRDALNEERRPRIEIHADYYFISFYAANCDSHSPLIHSRPVYMFVGCKYLITVHREPVSEIEETLNRWRTDSSPLECRIGPALNALLDAFLDDYFPILDQVADLVDDLENSIFTHPQDTPIQTIFELRKNLLHFRRLVAPERDVVNVLLRRDLPIHQQEDVGDLQDIYDRTVRLTENIDLYRDLLSSALDSYVSIQSNRLNEVVKVLTIASVLLMTDALVAGIYGMNFLHMPELHWRFGYLFALGVMVVSNVSLALYFKRKGWL
ncbi:MAG TPA: magnesium/cobalt transporter CorA [Rhodothermales bacterium]|nr:magnesium/cobalt transporter CorA [Rhodothermales bacterium]